ncbi:MAG: hypothetical protein WAP23_04250 [Candidatus Spechtbacterales bacterium]
MFDHHLIPISGTGIEIGDMVVISKYKVGVIGRQGIIYDPALGHQAYVSEGELAGIADANEVLTGCIVVAFTCGDHDPPCEYQVVYRKLDMDFT